LTYGHHQVIVPCKGLLVSSKVAASVYVCSDTNHLKFFFTTATDLILTMDTATTGKRGEVNFFGRVWSGVSVRALRPSPRKFIFGKQVHLQNI